jgi:hypothetical protein
LAAFSSMLIAMNLAKKLHARGAHSYIQDATELMHAEYRVRKC